MLPLEKEDSVAKGLDPMMSKVYWQIIRRLDEETRRDILISGHFITAEEYAHKESFWKNVTLPALKDKTDKLMEKELERIIQKTKDWKLKVYEEYDTARAKGVSYGERKKNFDNKITTIQEIETKYRTFAGEIFEPEDEYMIKRLGLKESTRIKLSII